MMAPGRAIATGGIVAALAVGGVSAISLHRAGLYALPGDRIIVWFPTGVAPGQALRRIGRSGTTLSQPGPWPGAYRVYVVRPAAPRRLAETAWVLRDPVHGFAQCFGIVSPGVR